MPPLSGFSDVCRLCSRLHFSVIVTSRASTLEDDFGGNDATQDAATTPIKSVWHVTVGDGSGGERVRVLRIRGVAHNSKHRSQRPAGHRKGIVALIGIFCAGTTADLYVC